MRLLAVAVLLGTAVWFAIYPSFIYRIRFTVSVDTPQGAKSGSSVDQLQVTRYPAWMTFGGGNFSQNTSIDGEAVFVDLGADETGKPQNLIALMRLGLHGEDVNFQWLPAEAIRSELRRVSSDPYLELLALPIGTRIVLPGRLIPTLVSFADLNNPGSLRAVDPNNLQSIFGKGVHLRNITMEIVASGRWPLTLFDWRGASVTRTLGKRFPWWVGADRPASIALKAGKIYPGEPETAFKMD